MTSARVGFTGCVHLVWTRWRALLIGGVLGLLFAALLMVGAAPAYAQSRAGAAIAQAPAGKSASPQRTAPPPPCDTPGGGACPDDPTNPLTDNQCSVLTGDTGGSCEDLVIVIQQWTRWAAWLLGGLGVLWILVGFYSSDRPWRTIWLRILEAALVVLIAWRIGDIAQVIEGVFWANSHDPGAQLSNSVNTVGNHPGLVGPPQHAIAQLLGLAMALIVQVFLLYQSPRIVFQMVSGISKLAGAKMGASFPIASVTGALVRGIALGAAIFYAPTILIWLFTFLTG